MSWPENYVAGENTATVTLNVYQSDGTTVVTSGLVSAFSGTDATELNLVPNNGAGFSDDLGDGARWCTLQIAMAANATVNFKYKNSNGEVFNLTYLVNSTPTSEKALNANDIWGGYGAAYETPEPIIFTIVPNTGGGGGTDTVKPIITSGTTRTNLVENSGAGQPIYTIEATDNVAVTGYAIAGTDASLLSVDPDSGIVTLTANPDYENKSSYSFDVTATDGTNTSESVTVTFSISNANDPTTGMPSITLSGTGTLLAPIVGDILTANQSNVYDEDGVGTFSYRWANSGSDIIGATGQTYTLTDNEVGGKISVIISFNDNLGNQEESSPSNDTGIVVAKPVDELTYFWTEYFADVSNNIPADSTLIHYGIYNTTKISGVQFTYDVSGSTTVADVSYSIVDNSNNNTAVYKKEWLQMINNTNDVAYQSMVFWGNVSQTLNGMVTGTFAIIDGNITLKSIVGITNHLSENIATTNVVLAEPQNPPTIENPGGRILGDLNFDASLNNTDADIMSAYLLNDTDISFNTYDSNGAEITPKKTAQEIIDEMMGGEWLEHVDINANGHVDVGDLVRILSKIADPTFNMSSGL